MKTKRTLFAAFCAVAAFATTMAANDVTLNWHAELLPPDDGKSQANMVDIKIDAHGDVYEFGSFGSKGVNPEAATFMEQSFVGAPYLAGTSYFKNLLLVKHDRAGNLKWLVYGNGGDFDQNRSSFAPTADGGAFLAVVARRGATTASTSSNVLLRLVGADGSQDSVEVTCAVDVLQPVLVKIDANGRIEKMKLLVVDWTLEGSETTIKSGFDFRGGVAEDADGNFYVAGHQMRDIAIDGQTLTHHNTEGWDGKSSTVGNAFLIKLDANLNYVTHITTGGTAQCDRIWGGIVYNDGKLYLPMLLLPSANMDAITFAGKTLMPTTTAYVILAARLDLATLQADWLSPVNTFVANSKNSVQPQSFVLSSDKTHLILCGGLQGGVSVAENNLQCGSSNFNGFVLKFDENMGTCNYGTVNSAITINHAITAIGGKDSVYTVGYSSGDNNLSLISYNTNLEKGVEYSLVNQNGTTVAAAAIGDTLFVSGRYSKATTIKYLTSTESISYSGTGLWWGSVASFTFPGRNFTPKKDDGTVTAIETTGSEQVQLYTERNMLTIAGAEGQNVCIFTALGQNIATFVAASNYETRTLPQGIYLVAIDGKAHKVVVK